MCYTFSLFPSTFFGIGQCILRRFETRGEARSEDMFADMMVGLGREIILSNCEQKFEERKGR
jgi:hypothetical protein